MLVRCPECKTEFRLVGFEGDERVVRYLCSACSRIVRLDLELDEVPSSSSAGSYRSVERRRTVLVADDAVRSLKAAALLLREAGFQVVTARDGEEALLRIREHHPDLVVLDLLMPRMSGFDVLREMERDERIRDIPVVATSGVYHQGVDEFLRERGASGFVPKRRLSKALLPATRRLLGGEPTI